jgi:alkanesulfonate monooxygenase SsuD/methylene tetrahydromethanopterin reductase-like flavin-dependent oxidoreductase (luciferase family)
VADFGIVTTSTQYTMQPAELGRWLEAHGFESLWFGEHSHILTSRESPYPGGELPDFAKDLFDPFIGLTAAAVATTKLKLGTFICLVSQHNAINLAKTVASLDRASNGRFLFGIGAGWNAEEMADRAARIRAPRSGELSSDRAGWRDRHGY